MDGETKEIKISANSNKVSDLLERFGKNAMDLKGKGYFNPASGTIGILIYSDDDTSQLIDIFISDLDK